MAGVERTNMKHELDVALRYERDIKETKGPTESRTRRRDDDNARRRRQRYKRQSYPVSTTARGAPF